MISFIDLPGGWKTFLLCLMLILNLYQFGYLFMLYMHKKIRLLLLNLLPTAFIFAAMPLLGNSVHNDSGCLKDAPVAAILLIWLLIGIYTAVSIISESRKAKEMLTLNSVKGDLRHIAGRNMFLFGKRFAGTLQYADASLGLSAIG